jgi:preprotein translocase subunit SecF
MWIIKNRKIFYWFSAVMVGFSVFAVLFWGIRFGIDFTGGSILEINFTEQKLDKDTVAGQLNDFNKNHENMLGAFSLRETGERGYILRTAEIDNDQKENLLLSINGLSAVEEIRFNTVGPVLGSELKSKALFAIFLVVLAVVIFIAYAFRQVSKPVSSWNYGFVAILALIHDILMPLGLFAVLGQFAGIEVDTLFVVAILVVLGYSINDTIVVFDRIRENLLNYPDKKRAEQFESVVGKSLNQTLIRSINTSLTTLIALLAIFFLGGESTKYFSLALIAGIVSGTYSSIFLASFFFLAINILENILFSINHIHIPFST